MRLLVLPLVAVLLAAGCLNVADPDAPVDPALVTGAYDVVLGNGVHLHATAHQAGLGIFHVVEGVDARVTFPPGVLVQQEDGRLVVSEGPVDFTGGKGIRYLPPYGAERLEILVEANGQEETLELSLAEGPRLVSGDLAVELMRVQEAQFPHRTPGMPNYEASKQYFKAYFEALGYEVEVIAYGSTAKAPAGPFQPGPQSLESVVAYKKGTTKADRYLVFGGHFDVVEGTTHGAFDNTAGTVATLAVAEAFANLTTERTLVFGLWGGEEDGILGSQAWLLNHPDLVPRIDGYFNFDVTALAWPAPMLDPSPLVVTAGPDGPLASALHGHAKTILEGYLQVDAPFVYESWARHQATGTLGQGGAGVNAQSDHTPFAMRGIPSFFPFTSRVTDVLGLIHKEKDTLETMVKYAWGGMEAVDQELSAAELAEGEWHLARSFETQMMLGFYYAVLTDAGVLDVPGPTSQGSILPDIG